MSPSIPTEREILCQQMAAGDDLRGAACAGKGSLWTHHEAILADSCATNDDISKALAVLGSHCVNCPVKQRCAEWAETDRHWGFAAGSTWTAGRRRANRIVFRPKQAA